MTMIIVTHEVRFAREVADRVLFMDGGVIVEQGGAEQVLDRPVQERTRRFLRMVGPVDEVVAWFVSTLISQQIIPEMRVFIGRADEASPF